jgi:hypothetical protein
MPEATDENHERLEGSLRAENGKRIYSEIEVEILITRHGVH